MIRVTRAEFKAIMAKADKRRQRRLGNRRFIAKISGVKTIADRTDIKKQIVHELGLLDRKINGPYCRLGVACPAHVWTGHHPGEVAYHIIPQMRGDAARFIPENVVWACAAANRGEQMNRSLYEDKHVTVFGRDRIERIKAIARTTADFSTAELIEKLADIRRQIGGLR